jgi:hypothetical protein
MTLILSAHRGGIAVQVSDRLTSVTDRFGRSRPWDHTWNKTVLLLARDAVVAISFSGLAYLDERPTDQWLTETLWGERINVGGHGLLAVGRGQVGPLRSCLRLLSARLEQELMILPRDARAVGVHLSITGWRFSHGQVERVALAVRTMLDGRIEFLRRCRARSPEEARLVRVCADPPGWLGGDDVLRVERTLVRAQTVRELEEALIAELRAVARRSGDRIGEDCMLIRIPRSPTRIGVRFAPVVPLRGRVSAGKLSAELGIGYFPCVVAPGAAQLASRLGGSGSRTFGNIEIDYEAPGVAWEGMAVEQGYERRRPPAG